MVERREGYGDENYTLVYQNCDLDFIPPGFEINVYYENGPVSVSIWRVRSYLKSWEIEKIPDPKNYRHDWKDVFDWSYMRVDDLKNVRRSDTLNHLESRFHELISAALSTSEYEDEHGDALMNCGLQTMAIDRPKTFEDYQRKRYGFVRSKST